MDDNSRIDEVRTAFLQLLNTLWRRNEVSLKTQLFVSYATFWPLLMYACETWSPIAEVIRRLKVFDQWCHDRISNATIRNWCHMGLLAARIKLRPLHWFGHILRLPDQAMTRIVLAPFPNGSRWARRELQREIWLHTFLKTWTDLAFVWCAALGWYLPRICCQPPSMGSRETFMKPACPLRGASMSKGN